MCFGVFQDGREVRSQSSEKDLSMKELREHPGRNVTPMPERGGHRHPCEGLGITKVQV